MTNLNDKDLTQSIFCSFNNLFENKIIYHERVTVLCEVDSYRISQKGFRIWLRPIKPLYLGHHDMFANMYFSLVEKEIFTLAASFEFGDCKLFDGKRIGRPYCPFSFWPGKELVEKVSKLSEEDLREQLYELLWE